MSGELAGLGRMIVFDLRRSWMRMLVWALVLAVLVLAVVAYQAQTFTTQADRDAYAAVANTPAVAALTGLPYAAGTAGGILNIKLWMTNAIATALVCIFLVARNGRAEEESGRAELLRTAGLGRHSLSVAGYLVTTVFAVLSGMLCGLAAVASGLPVDGSLLMGASFAGLGVAFVGVAAITGQLASTASAANAWAALVLAAAYLVRAVADVNGEGESASWLTWLSPIGWAQQTRSFGENRWWALLPLLGLGLLGVVVAMLIERRRDLGASIVPMRAGPVHVAAFTRTTFGLPLRLQRTPLIGWALALAVAGLFFGGIATRMAELVEQLGTSPLGEALVSGADSSADGLLGFFLIALALLVTAFAVQSTLILRTHEASGFAEIEWAGPSSRWVWGLARVLIPAVAALALLALGGLFAGASYGAQIGDATQAGRFTAAAIAYWPAVALVIAVVVLLNGWLPRAAIVISWALYGLMVLTAVLGDVLGLPHDVVQATPFWAVPQLGHPDPSWAPLWIMAGASLVLAGAGLWRLRSRDLIAR